MIIESFKILKIPYCTRLPKSAFEMFCIKSRKYKIAICEFLLYIDSSRLRMSKNKSKVIKFAMAGSYDFKRILIPCVYLGIYIKLLSYKESKDVGFFQIKKKDQFYDLDGLSCELYPYF